MQHHAAYGLNIDSLDIVIVDDSKTVLTMVRSMISALKVARVRSYDRGDVALQAIMHEPPNVILTDLAMSPMSGMQLLRLVRQRTMEPLSFIPVMVITAHATQNRVAQLFEAGAHHVMAKPLSAAMLQGRLRSLVSDPRMMRLEGERYVIDGMHEVLEEKRSKLRKLEKARQFHEELLPKTKVDQRTADRIMNSTNSFDEFKEELPEPGALGSRFARTMRRGAPVSDVVAEGSSDGRVTRGRRYASVGARRR